MGRLNASAYTADRDDWRTPQDFYDALDVEFQFTLDAAASDDNAKASAHYTRDDDALTQDWTGSVWVNPPFGAGEAWLRKGWQSAQTGATVVMLIPCRTDSVYWHRYAMEAAEIRFIRGRMQFEVPGRAPRENVAPFPSAVVVFHPGRAGPPVISAIDRQGRRVTPRDLPGRSGRRDTRCAG